MWFAGFPHVTLITLNLLDTRSIIELNEIIINFQYIYSCVGYHRLTRLERTFEPAILGINIEQAAVRLAWMLSVFFIAVELSKWQECGLSSHSAPNALLLFSSYGYLWHDAGLTPPFTDIRVFNFRYVSHVSRFHFHVKMSSVSNQRLPRSRRQCEYAV